MSAPEPPSYLQMVERNNELLGRLVDLLAAVPMPLEWRPQPGSTWFWPCLWVQSSACPLAFEIHGLAGGMEAKLVDRASGRVFWRQVLEWVDP